MARLTGSIRANGAGNFISGSCHSDSEEPMRVPPVSACCNFATGSDNWLRVIVASAPKFLDSSNVCHVLARARKVQSEVREVCGMWHLIMKWLFDDTVVWGA